MFFDVYHIRENLEWLIQVEERKMGQSNIPNLISYFLSGA
jgi:hypothetical protein